MRRRGLFGLVGAAATIAVGGAAGKEVTASVPAGPALLTFEEQDRLALAEATVKYWERYGEPPELPRSTDMISIGSMRQVARYEMWRGNPIWTSRDGSRTAIKDLDDGHLLNIERMLRGQGLTRVDPDHPSAAAWRPVIYEEMVRRGLEPFERYTGAFGERGYGV